MKSYIPKQAKLTRERVEAKLEISLVRKLEAYCAYLESDRDYVISQAVEIALRKDKGFERWFADQAKSAPGSGVSVPVAKPASDARRPPTEAAVAAGGAAAMQSSVTRR